MTGFRIRFRWMLPAVAAVLMAAHIGLVFAHYPVRLLAAGAPLCANDLGIHFAGAAEGAALARARGGLWGYSPTYMAGYPFGAWDSFSRRGYEYVATCLPFLTLPRAFYLYALCAALAPPFLLAAASALLGGGRRRTWLVFSLAVVVVQLDNLVSYFWTFGNLAFPLTTALVAVYLACAQRGIAARGAAWMAAAGALLALVFWLHQIAFLVAAVGSAVILWQRRRDLLGPSPFWGALWLPAVALVLALPWALVLARYAWARVGRESHALESGWRYAVMDFLSDRAYRHHFDRRSLLHVEAVLLVLGWRAALRDGRPRWAVLPATALACLVLAYAASAVPVLRELEPYRFLVCFSLLAAIPAAAGLVELRRLLRAANPAARWAALAVAAVLVPSLAAYALDVAKREPAHGPAPQQAAVTAWLQHSSHGEGRVLCVDEALADLVPFYTARPVLGGALTRSSPLAHKACWDLAQRALGAAGAEPAAFAALLDAYNVGTVIGSADRLPPAALAAAGLRETFVAGRYVVYERDPTALSYVEGGAVTSRVDVAASMDRLLIRGAPRGDFVLKFHADPSLRAPPGVRLSPVWRADDPVAFIGVSNPSGLSEIEIRPCSTWTLLCGGGPGEAVLKPRRGREEP